MTLDKSVMLKADANIQHLCMSVHGEALRQFDALSAEVESASPEALTYDILGLGAYFLPINAM